MKNYALQLIKGNDAVSTLAEFRLSEKFYTACQGIIAFLDEQHATYNLYSMPIAEKNHILIYFCVDEMHVNMFNLKSCFSVIDLASEEFKRMEAIL